MNKGTYQFYIGFLIGLSLFPASTAIGQTLITDISFLETQLTKVTKTKTFAIGKLETNEIRIGVQLLFIFYKNFLSSQDNRTCAFTPSCSTYCVHSVQKRGIIRGVMGAFDRLSRCNFLSPENYTIEFRTGRLIDPVETNP